MSVVVDITKKLAEYTFHIAFSVENEWVGLLGASGSGKSMTLKCIAGVETPDEGCISINGCTVFDSVRHINIKPQNRNVGYLFQNYGLFPTMNVRENISIVLHSLPSIEQKRRTAGILSRFGIMDLADRRCSELSGGQMQRVALARMMVKDPALVMLDEPFSALDSFIRQQVEDEVSTLLKEFPGTVLFVSHSRDEVYRLCNSLRVIDHGTICAEGRTEDLFQNPRNIVTARLSGCKNIVSCVKTGEHSVYAPEWGLSLVCAGCVPDTISFVGIRAHYIRPARRDETTNVFTFIIKAVRPGLFSTSTFIAVPGAVQNLLWETGTADVLSPEIKQLCLPPDAIMLLSE
jgi:molybdate transport system ATP-binding protein